jgi:predicted RecB family nuclease
MTDRLLTPSKITAWLDCAHFLTLQHDVDAGALVVDRSPFGEMAQLLLDKGLEHEAAVLAAYRAQGLTVFEVPPQDRDGGESFERWVARVGNPLADGHDVVFQMPFVHDGIRGIADFLVRTVDPEGGPAGGTVTYEPVDAKLARKEAKPGHVLQLCFYAEALGALTGSRPARVRIALGSGEVETIRVSDVLPYWRRLRSQLARLVDAPPTVDTFPEPCDHCQFCQFEMVCEGQWRAADSLVHVAGVRPADRLTLRAGHVGTIARLAELDRPIDGLDDGRRDRFVRQARLQVAAREHPDDPPPFELVAETNGALNAASETEAVGFAAMPEPDEGDVFLDFEGHPFWRADVGLFFLFGWIERSDRPATPGSGTDHRADSPTPTFAPPDPRLRQSFGGPGAENFVTNDDGATGGWEFRAIWAHDRAGEAAATKQLVEYLDARRQRFPNMHVYHYNHTERSSLQRLTLEHGVAELELERLIETGMFVDLYRVITASVQAGTESYGLKQMERLARYERGHEIDRGAGAVVEYERWMRDRDGDHLTAIAAYNEDDVRATRAVRDWLVEQRPATTPWRSAVLDKYKPNPELDEQIEALHAFGPGTDEHLMGDLLGYWRREKSAVAADVLRLSTAPDTEQMESPNAIARLKYVGLRPEHSPKTGKKLKWDAAVFTFPPQPVDADIRRGDDLMVALNDREWAFFEVASIDRRKGELRVTWTKERQDSGVIPTSLVRYSWFQEGAKLVALQRLGDDMRAGNAIRVGHSMLRRELPRFTSGSGGPGGPRGGEFTGGLDDIRGWVTQLDGSFVPIQGPPGTGKTFTGAHIISTLVQAGQRVGVTAMSHHAIDNLMEATVARFVADGNVDELHAARRSSDGDLAHVTYVDDNGAAAKPDFNVVAGTPWLFASTAMRDNPVDVLIVDEAGQLGLADTLAASISAANVILLGDPQQLPQVSQASHPNGAGASALEHILGDDRTVSADRGVLLDVTWRMHPRVCKFVSDTSYESKLASHESCAGQSTAAGVGLRWVRAEHAGRSTESPEEAELVARTIGDLMGSDWTDQHGVTRPLTAADFIVVAPYNDQRRLIESVLAKDSATKAVPVGTVDKFQGREAAVVVFSMATSSKEFMPRTSEFLFSKNRLNVAISRARCLAYLVCTDDLLDTRARTVEEMTLISALCSFVERAKVV